MTLFLTRKLIFSMGLIFAFHTHIVSANDPSSPGFPTVPPSYEVLHAAKLVAAARVDFPSYRVERTNGYQVTAPNGTEFIVDNIVKPKCAFYGTYVSTNDDGFLGVGGNTPVKSNVYIGEVNFENCQ